TPQNHRSQHETGNDSTHQRDKKLAKSFKQTNIVWQQPYQNGVVRCLADRDNWDLLWHQLMSEKIIRAPTNLKFICENQIK
ncbi:deoxyribodipyrimidine photolyase, partial [Francisella tularensis subsp. holarctica]|nr:deoxyribodipyrimidine photolyase [Francisella tularensis subsp. holarctica]